MIEIVGFEQTDVEMKTFISKLVELRELLLDDFGEDESLKLHSVPNGSCYNFDANEILFAEVLSLSSLSSSSCPSASSLPPYLLLSLV
jgi:hypothetical protein